MSKIIALLLAISFSFLLFVGMTLLIEPNQVEASPIKDNPSVSITFIPKDDPIGHRIRFLKKPKEPEVPPVVRTVIETNAKHDKVARLVFEAPSFKTKTGSIFDLPSVLGGSRDGTLTPRVRINPNYPRPAAIEGIEGYVTLSFDISPMGITENIRIVEANPRGYFERSARKALRKWKYSPKMVENKPVGVQGETVTLQYRLEKELL